MERRKFSREFKLEAVETIAGRSRLVAVMNGSVFARKPAHKAPHALFRSIDFSKETNLVTAFTVRNCNGIARLGNVDSNKNLAILLHGSSSCDEDRFGPSEQPSPEQRRMSHSSFTDGHTALRLSAEPSRVTIWFKIAETVKSRPLELYDKRNSEWSGQRPRTVAWAGLASL